MSRQLLEVPTYAGNLILHNQVNFEFKSRIPSPQTSLPDMSNSIETPIDIDFFGGIDIGIDIDSGYPWKIDIGIDIDFLKFEILTLALTLTFLSSMSMGNQNPLKLSF